MPDPTLEPIGPRSKLDEHVERAFDLLSHYKDFVCRRITDERPEIRRAMDQLEAVLREWLPLAFDANDPIVNGIASTIGDRPAAAEILRDMKHFDARRVRLLELANALVPPPNTAIECIGLFRREVAHWRSLLPYIYRRPGGESFISDDDRRIARQPGYYWSLGIEERPSRIGASYTLARASELLAVAAAKLDFAPDVVRPAAVLPVRLRRHPHWAHLEPLEDTKILSEQIELIGRVEDLVAEMEVALVASSRTPDRSRTEPTRTATGRPKISTRRPTAAVIDATARDYLLAAMEAAREAGQPHIPRRADIAAATSKALNYEIKVEDLFGTKEAPAGSSTRRVDRHPEFARLWRQRRQFAQDAGAARKGRSTKRSSRS